MTRITKNFILCARKTIARPAYHCDPNNSLQIHGAHRLPPMTGPVVMLVEMAVAYVRFGSSLCENSSAETFRAIYESGEWLKGIIVAMKANLLI